MRITSIQLEIADRPKGKNIEYAVKLLDDAPESDLILFPEIWPCGFLSFDRYRSEAEPIDGTRATNTWSGSRRTPGSGLVIF